MQENNNDYDQFEFDDENTRSLVGRYEDMLQKNLKLYFDIEEFEIIINHYIWTNDTADALIAINIAESFFPDSNIIQIRRAEVLILKNESYSALNILNRLERFEPYNAQINFVKAKANIEIDNMREANRQFELALKKDTDNQLDLLMQIADYLVWLSDFDLALKYLKRAYKLNSNNIDVLYQIAYCYDRLGDLDNCISFYNKCLDEDPFDEGIWHNLGTIYSRKNMYNKAIEAFDFAITINEFYQPSLYNKANTLANIERYSDAIEVFNSFLKLEPDNLYAQCTIGECYEKLGEFEKATNCYTQVLTEDDNFSDAYYGLSIVKYRQGLYDDSAIYITKALELDSENSDFWFSSGELLYKTGYNNEALTAFLNTVEYNPYDIEAWVYISEIVFENEGAEGALLELKKAYVDNYNAPQLHYRLAAMYYIVNNMDDCFIFLKNGLSHKPELVDVFFSLCPEARNDITITKLLKEIINN